MPLNKEAALRYKIIDDCLRNRQKPFPTMMDLQRAMEDKLGKEVSESTIQKDIKAMKEDDLLGFHAPIVFDRKYQGYNYTHADYSINKFPLNQDDVHSIEFAASLLQPLKHIELIDHFNDAAKKLLGVIDYSSSLNMEDRSRFIELQQQSHQLGSQLLKPILQGIFDKKRLRFTYHAYQSSKTSERLLDAYLLKQYDNRWYVIGIEAGKVKTFGLDRISDLQLTKESFKATHAFDAEKYFSNTFGITSFEGEPEEVVLSFTPLAGRYITSAPMHTSQKIVSDTSAELRISLQVGITYELVKSILSHGENVLVVKPAHLRKQVMDSLKNALKKYSAEKNSGRK